MFIYSEKIIQFVQEVKFAIKSILSTEVRLKVVGDRFFDNQQCSYPISVVIYNHKNLLGYFDPNFHELGFHESLMHVGREQLYNTIRHELAHYMTFIQHEYLVPSHGPEFRAFCLKMGWGKDVYSATLDLTGVQKASRIEESDVFRKVQKLMALSTSSNKNEAEMAMIKSQQLLLKYNIESKYVDLDERLYLKRIMKQSRENAKMRAIAKILETFFVSVVYRRGEDGIYVEILGSEVNIQIAEYVAEILQDRFDRLWDQTKQEHSLKGQVAKNSFFLGIARGYKDKIDSLQKSYQSDETSALMVIEGKLQKAQSMVYDRLSSSKSQGSYSPEASKLGEMAGKQLNINPGVSSSENSGQLVDHKKSS